jgi:hypothetical protein
MKNGFWNGSLIGYFLDNSECCYSFPDVSYDKSLIAPDGRLILMEETKSEQHKKWHPKRFEPIFVWDDKTDVRIPAIVVYYWGKSHGTKFPVITCEKDYFNKQGFAYQHMRKFDASLVGIPLKYWPKDEQGNLIDAY